MKVFNYIHHIEATTGQESVVLCGYNKTAKFNLRDWRLSEQTSYDHGHIIMMKAFNQLKILFVED